MGVDMPAYYAHSLESCGKHGWHPLRVHLRETARLAAARGRKFGAAEAAACAGLLHDLGKYTEAFQRRLEGGGPVEHSTAGAREVLAAADRAEVHLAELLAHAIAGHHAGMPDRRGDAGGTLEARLGAPPSTLDALWRNELGPLPTSLMPEDFDWHRGDPRRLAFQLSMLGRFLFSCLVDADFRDTEAFFASAQGRPVERDIDLPLSALRDRLDAHLRGLSGGAGQIDRHRATILAHVRAQAGREPGLFSLTVPTGGGKTLASLAFALDHAIEHGLDRVIYAIPFTSIIDQTAGVFRQAVGDEAVLEHHSAIERQDPPAGDERSGAAKLKLAMEDWAAPIVVTTNVQVFESLFANRPGRCRKLHNLARSVLVLDEAQTIPRPVLRPCVATVDELARNYRSSVVLCTATQPALNAPDFAGGLANVRELAPDPPTLQRRFARVTFRRAGALSDDDLVEALADTRQGLVIVNSRAHALALYRRARDADLGGLVHLTTRMVAAHRRQVLAGVRDALAGHRPCRVVATSLIEAGVDLDFPRVWRAEAGLDSVMQAAGRCNREGRRAVAESVVTLFRPAEAEHAAPREIAALAGDMARVAECYDDLADLAAIRDYFLEVYWRVGPEQLDRHAILEHFKVDARETDMAYRSAAERFRLIEKGMAPVVVRRDRQSADAVAALAHADKIGGLARRLQPYLVQIPPKARDELVRHGQVRYAAAASLGEQFAVLEDEALYGEDTGLVWEEAGELRTNAAVV